MTLVITYFVGFVGGYFLAAWINDSDEYGLNVTCAVLWPLFVPLVILLFFFFGVVTPIYDRWRYGEW